MSDFVSPPPPPFETAIHGARRRLQATVCLAIGILWATLVFLRFSYVGPEDSVTACRHAIYRDPVTGREQGIGSARIAQDGAMTCHGVIYPIGAR